MRRTANILLMIAVIAIAASRAYAESITLTTYYPAPFGAYDRIQLVPRANIAQPCDPGTLYVEQPSGSLRFCRSNQTWVDLTGVWTQDVNSIYPADTQTNPNLQVAIGTITPAASTRLTIQGQGNTSGTSGLRITDSGGNTSLLVRDDRQVGIREPGPAYALDVNGSFGGTFDGTNKGVLRVTYVGTGPNPGYYAVYSP